MAKNKKQTVVKKSPLSKELLKGLPPSAPPPTPLPITTEPSNSTLPKEIETFWELYYDRIGRRREDREKEEGRAIWNMFSGLDEYMVFTDLGCGTGGLLQYLEVLGATVRGVDFLPSIEKNKLVDNIEIRDIRDSKSYQHQEIVICFDILDYLSEIDILKVLKKLKEDDSKFIVFSPADSFYKVTVTSKNREQWIELFGLAGFFFNTILSNEFDSKVETDRRYYQVYSSRRY